MKLVRIDEREDPILVRTNARALDALLAAEAKIAMACGGKGLCATCHVYVDEGADQLTPKTPREHMSLRMLADVKDSSRLACQAKVLGPGVRLSMPRGRFIEATADLEALVGRRAEERILHPVDGRVLIEAGKIITRTRIRELASLDVEVAELKTRSLSARR